MNDYLIQKTVAVMIENDIDTSLVLDLMNCMHDETRRNEALVQDIVLSLFWTIGSNALTNEWLNLYEQKVDQATFNEFLSRYFLKIEAA